MLGKMICDGCGQQLVVSDTDWGEDEGKYRLILTCPNFTSAFMEFIYQEQLTQTYDNLGEYPCERMYEIPLHYTVV